eukprot:TRINITY_DN8173_c0_g1_i3.p1 TRINITY_DN8173_c0_g1~~TRINITY_DN8173_c0_g1_i3.p1  ORF type:complete len:173 (+),score=30.97 TRINITY_DN8173_c0_g1_i3:161-679(+)
MMMMMMHKKKSENDQNQSQQDFSVEQYEKLIALKYYNKLYKEYVIADFTKYKTGEIGLRWRTQHEVISGKGKLICANKKCQSSKFLSSYEINFSYIELGQQKNALVKIRVCKDCAQLLNFFKNHQLIQEKTIEPCNNQQTNTTQDIANNSQKNKSLEQTQDMKEKKMRKKEK